MRTRNLLILAIAVVLVAGYILLFERHQPTSEEAREQAERVLPGLDRDRVVAVDIDGEQGEVRLERSGDDWRIVRPLDFPADATAVSSLLGSLENLDRDRVLPSEEVDPAEYGLDEPEVTVAVELEDGGELRLQIGAEMPLGSNRALRAGGSGDVILAPGWFVTDLDRELDEWRSRDVVDLVSSDVASLEIVGRDGDTIEAVRVGDLWRLLEPVEDLAHREHLRNLVSDLNALRVAEFADGADPGELGLDAPAWRITVVRADGDEPVRLALGETRPADTGEATEVALRRGDDLFWVTDQGVLTRLARAPVLWRSRSLYPLDTWSVDRLTLRSGEQAVALERAEGMWRTGEGDEVDGAAVHDRLTLLAEMEAIDYDLVLPDAEPTGRVEVVLTGEDVRPVTFTFFPSLTADGKPLATVSGRDTVMSVDRTAVAELLADPRALIVTEAPPEKTGELPDEPE